MTEIVELPFRATRCAQAPRSMRNSSRSRVASGIIAPSCKRPS